MHCLPLLARLRTEPCEKHSLSRSELHENAIHPRLLCPAALLPGICRKGTLFRLDHLKKNYPDAHPCTKLCVLESHCKSYVL